MGEPVVFGPHPDDAERMAEPGTGDVLDVDAEAHLRWLETGEGEPWPPARSR